MENLIEDTSQEVNYNETPFQAVKKIKLRPQNFNIASQIEAKFKSSPLVAKILAARGFQADENLAAFLNPTLKSGLPHPSKIKNLKSSAELLAQEIKKGKKIAICCDFDVDGLSGGSMLYQFLSDCEIDSKVYIPDRFTEGYGLCERIVNEAVNDGSGVLIAIDFGTTNLKEVALAKEKGLTVIVIDHHHVGSEIPASDYFVNPEQEGCGFSEEKLCAAGLVWYFLITLKEVIPSATKFDLREYLEFACLGTICDMVPLTGANRVIAKKGLERLAITPRCGFRSLLAVSGAKKKVVCSDVSFGMGPRINAAGRLGDPAIVVELLTTNDPKRADSLANKLDRLNSERHDYENKIKSEAMRRISKMLKLPYGIVISDKGFHTGVIGIVAQRLSETYYRPSAVIGCDKNGVFKGSCRGVKGFNVVKALENCSQYLLGYGGHTGAGGFSLEEKNISSFSIAFNSEASRQLATEELNPTVEADTIARLEEIDSKLITELEVFIPYGMANSAPVLLLKDLRVLEVTVLKSAHLRVLVSDGKRNVPALLWKHTSHYALKKGAHINLACRPLMNSFNGLLEVQLQIQAAEIVA